MASARTVLFSFLVIHILNGTAGESNLSEDNLVPSKADGKTYYVDSHIPKSERLGTPQLIQHSGHEYEEFDVSTEDKYVLKLFHIKGNWSEDPPILLLHGVMDSSDTFLTRGKESLAIHLTESGYDVWLGNFRGNKYSRRHLVFDPIVDDKYWDYSFHENGFYDSPAMIDFVLNVTGKSQVIVVGHSQGTLNQFVTGATRPEYNHKIKVFIALAPIFFTNHYKGIAALADIIPPSATAAMRLGKLDVELLDPNSIETRFIQELCVKDMSVGYALCGGILFGLLGEDREELEPEFLPIAIEHYFSGGTTVKTCVHATQFFNNNFRWFDYGPVENLVRYGSTVPPIYDLSKFTSQIVLMVGKNDFVGDPEDCMVLRDALPNAEYFEMPREKFNHVDFVWGRHMREYFFPYLHKFLKKYI